MIKIFADGLSQFTANGVFHSVEPLFEPPDAPAEPRDTGRPTVILPGLPILWLAVGMLALFSRSGFSATLQSSLGSHGVDRCTHENQNHAAVRDPKALVGLQPFEPVTSARAFDLTLLATASGTPDLDAIRQAPTPPGKSAQPHEPLPKAISGDEMVKWFGILGFIMLLTRGTRRR